MGYFSCRRNIAVATCASHSKKSDAAEKIYDLRLFSYGELESATNGFSPENLLGKGSHGAVYKAVLDDGKLVAAVKKATVLSTSPDENHSNSSVGHGNNSPGDNEIEILSKIRNLGLVNLLGFGSDSNESKLLVVEFMANGTLYDQLHHSLTPPRWWKRVQFALQTAKAVEALHSSNPPIIHRDIKSSNVLIDGDWNARLGDFGLALRGHVEDVRLRLTPPAGTLGYLDPCYLTPQNLSAKSDVFSFGILLLEMMSGRNAIDVNYSPPSVVDWAMPLIKRGELSSLYDPRIGLPKDLFVRSQLAAIAGRCVDTSPERRPSMGEVVKCLRLAKNRLCCPIWDGLTNRVKKSAPVIQEMDTNSIPNRSSDETHIGPNYVRRNSSRNRKVSIVPSNDQYHTKETNVAIVACNGCPDMTHLLSETNSGTDWKKGKSLSVGRTGLPSRKAVTNLRRTRSVGISRNGQTVLEREKATAFARVKCPLHLGSKRASRVRS